MVRYRSGGENAQNCDFERCIWQRSTGKGTGGGNVKIIVACEYSGKVREAFRKNGHDAWSCDLLPADDKSPYHIHGKAVGVTTMTRPRTYHQELPLPAVWQGDVEDGKYNPETGEFERVEDKK